MHGSNAHDLRSPASTLAEERRNETSRAGDQEYQPANKQEQLHHHRLPDQREPLRPSPVTSRECSVRSAFPDGPRQGDASPDPWLGTHLPPCHPGEQRTGGTRPSPPPAARFSKRQTNRYRHSASTVRAPELDSSASTSSFITPPDPRPATRLTPSVPRLLQRTATTDDQQLSLQSRYRSSPFSSPVPASEVPSPNGTYATPRSQPSVAFPGAF